MSTARFDSWQPTGGGTAVGMTDALAKAWWKYDQTTPAVDDSFNISSVTDESTGDFTLNFANIFVNGDYVANATTVTVDTSSTSTMNIGIKATASSAGPPQLHSTAQVRMIRQFPASAGANEDGDHNAIVIHGDLA